MIDLANPPKYLRQIDTGRIYIFDAKIAERADMEAYEMPEEEVKREKVPEEVTDEVTEPNVEMVEEPVVDDEKTKLLEEVAALQAQLKQQETVEEAPDGDDRIEKIKAAIAMIPVENYGSPYAGKPAMPKVADVSAAAGFKVYADEIGLVMSETTVA